MSDEISDLAAGVSYFSKKHGQALCYDFEESSELLLSWIPYLRSSQAFGDSAILLDGLHAALIETCSYISLGIVRPAVFAIRSQVDIALSWLFFKDHPIEWARVENEGEGYRLPAEVHKYLKTHFPKYMKRYKILEGRRMRIDTDPYRLLSAHVHGQNSATLPPLVKPAELVQSVEKCKECIELQCQISEFLGDIFAACFSSDWPDFPSKIHDHYRNRLSTKELSSLCE